MNTSDKFNAGISEVQRQGYKRATADVFNLAAALEKRGVFVRTFDGDSFDK